MKMNHQAHQKKFIFDLHLDLAFYYEFPQILKMKFSSLNKFDPQRHGDLIQFQRAKLKIAVTNIFPFIYNKSTKQWIPTNFEKVKLKLKKYLQWLKKYPDFQIVYQKEDLKKIMNQKNKIGLILGVEGLNFVQSPRDIFELYHLGIRVFGLNWNVDSTLATSLKTKKKFGLTEKGRLIVATIEKLPVVLDLAHSSSYTVRDVFKFYQKPLMFSHNGYKKIVNFEQNLDDQILNLLKKNHGLLGLTLLPYSLKINSKISFSNWLLQLKALKTKYAQNLALGTDFFGFEYDDQFEGCRNYLELSGQLQKSKISRKILFTNAFRFFQQLI